MGLTAKKRGIRPRFAASSRPNEQFLELESSVKSGQNAMLSFHEMSAPVTTSRNFNQSSFFALRECLLFLSLVLFLVRYFVHPFFSIFVLFKSLSQYNSSDARAYQIRGILSS